MEELLNDSAKEETGLPAGGAAGTTQSALVQSEKKAKLVFFLILLILIAGIVLSVVLLAKELSKREDFFPTFGWYTQETDESPDPFDEVSMPVYPITELEEAQAGDDVLFGSYEQDNDLDNGKEEIEWLVLEREGDRLLLLSRFGLDCVPFHETYEDVTWEDCSLRKWLNGTFFDEAFTEEEQKAVQSTELRTEIKEGRQNMGSFVTTDRVFLLSTEDFMKLLPDDFEMKYYCVPTPYAEDRDAGGYIFGYQEEKIKSAEWWLRSTGVSECSAAFVEHFGYNNEIGRQVDSEGFAVRPVIWIDLSAME